MLNAGLTTPLLLLLWPLAFALCLLLLAGLTLDTASCGCSWLAPPRVLSSRPGLLLLLLLPVL
jgi:hypothetical protein